MTILLHIVFGLIAFAGSMTMSLRYNAEKANLSTAMKVGMVMTHVGVIVSAILGFAVRIESPMLIVGSIVAAVVYSIVAFAKPAPKSVSKTVQQ